MTGNDRDSGRSVRTSLTVAALFVLALVLAIAGIATRELRRESDPTAFEDVRDVPSRSVPTTPPSTGETSTKRAPVSEPGRVVLDVEGVGLAIESGAAGEPIRVDGTHDAARIAVTTEYTTYGDRGWVYRVRARGRGLINPSMRDGIADNTLRVVLPRGVPISLEGGAENSDARLDLGGLWLVDTDLRLKNGEFTLAFAEPLAEPMGRLAIDAPLGELTLARLGNASPREVRIEKNLGHGCLDLRGAWRTHATLELACGVGSCSVHEPNEGEAVVRRLDGFDGDATRVSRSPEGLTTAGDRPTDGTSPVIGVRSVGALADRVEIAERLRDEEG